MATDPVIDAWSALINELNLFVPVLADALDDQWDKSAPRPPKVGATVPAQEHPRRPVEEIVSDERRLALRATLQAATDDLKAARALMETSRRRVERAHGSWKGLDSPSEA